MIAPRVQLRSADHGSSPGRMTSLCRTKEIMTIDPGLRRLALHTLLAAFAGKSVPNWALQLLTDGLAGYTLFGTNIADPSQTARLTAELRAARPDALIAIDEEGGDVTRLAHRTGSPYPGNAALGAIDDPDLTHAVYAAIGADLTAAGINLNLAPTVDVNTADDNPVIGTRAFGADPRLVSRHAAAAVAGLQATGVAACAKHFPGHGATVTDSHLGLPVVDAPLSVLHDRDLPPFAAAIAGGSQAIMTAHIRIPALTGPVPATFSRAVLTDLLRREYGFAGVVVTDALEMRGATAAASNIGSAAGGSTGPATGGGGHAATSNNARPAAGSSTGLEAGGIGRAAVLSLAAGADLLCIGARVDRQLVEAIVAEIVAAVRSGELTSDRLEEAAARNAALAAWTLRPAAAETAGAPPPAAAGALGRDTAVGYTAARRAVRVEGSLAEITDPLVVQLGSSHSIAEGRVPWGLGPHLNGTEVVAVTPAVTSVEASVESLVELAGSRPIVVAGRRVHRSEAARTLVEALAARRAVAVVEMGWPSEWRPRGVRAFITTYGASHANGRAAAETLGLTVP
jgi:beta-N-acetylhexosaminidase